MPGFVRGCVGRSVRRGRDPLRMSAYAILSGLPATWWYFRTDVAPPPQRPPATFLAPQNDPPAIANALEPLRQSRCPVFETRKLRPLWPQRRVGPESARRPWLALLFQPQDTPYHARNPLPILGLHR